MSETPFDPDADLIIVPAILRGPHRDLVLRLVLDTGAAVTTIVPHYLHQIGYGARQGIAVSRVSSPIGVERGYLIDVGPFEVLGTRIEHLTVNALDVIEGEHDEDDRIDGLLGLDFLRRFNCEIRYEDARIRLERFQHA